MPAKHRPVVVGAHRAFRVLDEVEDEAVRVELRVVVPRRPVLEHGSGELATDELDVAAFGPPPRPGAVLPYDPVEGHPARVVVRPRDLLAQLLAGDRPERRDGLVGAERDVEAGQPLLRSGVPGERLARRRMEAAVELPELPGVDRGAVLETEEAARVPPAPVGLLSADVVAGRAALADGGRLVGRRRLRTAGSRCCAAWRPFAGDPRATREETAAFARVFGAAEGLLSLQVVGIGGHASDGGDHG